jgi:rare lipoprotein A
MIMRRIIRFRPLDLLRARSKAFALYILLLLNCFCLTACQQSPYAKLSREDRGNHSYKGHYKVGKEYVVNQVKYKPKEVKQFTQVGLASWYGKGDGFHGKKTANGDKYSRHMLTAAHKTLQLPSLVKVTNLSNNKSVIVLVNDRGPFCRKRIIDVSEKAADILGMKLQGVAKVKIEYLPEESKQFLTDMGLQKKHGSVSKKAKLANGKCTVNCHVKLVNLKHKIDVN